MTGIVISTLIAFTAVACGVHAQVLQVSGGDSSLYQASGGSLAVQAPSYSFSLGAGMVAGHFEAGTKLLKPAGATTYIIGDDQIDFRLPTDIFDNDHYLFARGAGLKTTRDNLDISAFAGVMSTMYETPIFEGAKGGAGLGFFSLRKKISPQWQLFSDTVLSDKVSQIAAVQWEPVHKLALALAGGVGANQPYAAASLNLSQRWVDLQGSYIQAGQEFHRVIVSSPMLAEPNKGNLLATIKPTNFLTLSASTQNYLVPEYPSNINVSSSVRQGSASLRLAGISLSGTAYDSAYQGQSNHAAAFTASRDIGQRVHVMSSYLASRPKGFQPTNSFVSTISETLNAHLAVNENVNASNGKPSVLFGGTLLTNIVTISANYETFYVPAQSANPFQESLILDLRLRLFGRLNLHGASFVGPTGHLLYTADVNGIMAHDQTTAETVDHASIGSSLLRGRVTDPEGRTVEGAALLVDALPIFTDSDGRFFVREKRPRIHKLTVLTDQFLNGGQWEVVSAPSVIRSSRRNEPEIAIVVCKAPETQQAAGHL